MTLDFGERTLVLRRGAFSARTSRRRVMVSIVLLAVTVALALVSLQLGTLDIGLGDLWSAITGDAERATMVLLRWRLPRLLFAVTCGAALAVAGALFQSLTRNPLGSPDIIGFTVGSQTGAVVVLLVIGSAAYTTIAAGTLIGGGLTALVVYALAYKSGLSAFRLIIVGIGVSAMLGSLNALLMLRVSVDQAMLAAMWSSGNMGDVGFTQFWPFLAGVSVALVAAGLLTPAMRQAEIGDDAAVSWGIRVNRLRLLAVMTGVGLVAAVTAAVGPIAFIALAAPQVAKRLTKGPLLDPIPVAITGAVLLTASDVIAQVIGIPTGIVTVTVGGGYLVWLLAAEFRSRKGS